MTIDELVEFLLARITDEEDLVRSARGTPHRTGWQLWTSMGAHVGHGVEVGPRGSIEASPRRVLAECESKRRIVERCAEVAAVTGWEYDDAPDLARWTLKLLALPYADHSDYREEWRP